MNFDAIIDVLLTFKVLKSKSMNKNVPLLNKTQAEQNFAASVLTLMALSVSNHNGMLLADHSWFRNLFQEIFT